MNINESVTPGELTGYPLEVASMPECDLVMKGGVTSGIVYPSFVLELKDEYKFRSVGGTSAGAIAAAAIAAAEYGREKDGFNKLTKLQEELSQGTFLRDLFQPSRKTSPLFYFLLNFMELVKGNVTTKQKLTLAFKLLPSHFPLASILGAIMGLAIAFVIKWSLTGSYGFGFVILALVLLVIGAIIAAGFHIWHIVTKEVPTNFLGMCTGRLEDPEIHKEDHVLTVWLNNRINDMAGVQGRKEPLLFKDLKYKCFGDERDKRPPQDWRPNIDLRMVTSNLTQNQPYILPFEKHPFIFKKDDFSRFFPDDIVNYMTTTQFVNKDHKGKLEKYDLHDLQNKGYYFLPEADDLPVIVATRMSLSFPVLLSAVPLFTIKPDKARVDPQDLIPIKIGEKDLQRQWFSDGGISSNFPIHFFDGWLPERPTFGVNLVPLPKEQLEGAQLEKVKGDYMSCALNPLSNGSMRVKTQPDAVSLPKANEDVATEWIPLETKLNNKDKLIPNLSKFLWAIFTTAQNYRDNTQAMLPSYRERIVQIRLSEEEGGLNLAMSRPTIDKVIDKGKKAGEVVRTDFNFDIHSWVRFLVLMKQMEIGLDELEKVMANANFYKKFLRPDPTLLGDLQKDYPYPRDKVWFEEATKRIISLGEIIGRWKSKQPPLIFQEDSPIPEPILRVTPEL